MLGHTLAHYHILAKIGSGGMEDVYLAEDTKRDRNIPGISSRSLDDFLSLLPHRRLPIVAIRIERAD